MAFIAELLTAGLNAQNSTLSRKRRSSRGRKQYPRKSNWTLGYLPLRFSLLQYTTLVFIGCIAIRHSRNPIAKQGLGIDGSAKQLFQCVDVFGKGSTADFGNA